MIESKLRVVLRVFGAICTMAVVPLLMPRAWIEAGHQAMRLGSFPAEPIAEYLARSVSALCTFYGGLLLVISRDVRRFLPVIRFQAWAIMAFSAFGIHAGVRAGLPAKWVVADAIGCWVFLVPVLLLARRID